MDAVVPEAGPMLKRLNNYAWGAKSKCPKTTLKNRAQPKPLQKPAPKVKP